MRTARLAVHQLRYEQKSYWRNPTGAIFTFGFPLVFFVIFNSVFGNHDIGRLGPVKGSQYYTASVLGYGVSAVTFVNLAISLAIRRDSGVLKRMRATPLPVGSFVGGLIASSVVVSVLLTAFILAVGRVVYGVHLTAGHLLVVAVDVLVSAPCLAALGILVSSFAPNADAAPAVINLPYFLVTFISGSFFVVTGTLATVASVLPLRPFIQALFRCFDPRVTGSAWDWPHLGVVAAWGIGGSLLALRFFRWQRR